MSDTKGWYAQLVGFLPVFEPYCVQLFGAIGVNSLNIHMKRVLLQDTLAGAPVAILQSVGTRTFEAHKAILILNTGIQIQLDEKCSLRFKVGYEQTSQFKSIISKENSNAVIKLQDSFIYGLGITINFL